MTIEKQVKDLIIRKYKTLKNFASLSGMPYGTVDGILRRGFANSNYENVFNLCRTLGISADELSKGRIVSVNDTDKRTTELTDIIQCMKNDKCSMYGFTIDGVLLTDEEIHLIADMSELILDYIRKRRKA